MTGGKNIYVYITTEGKRSDKRTALEYLQKNTGVFNQGGMIPKETVDEMKTRLKENKGHIWHGFISFSEEDSPKIDTPEKCIRLIKNTFPSFFKEAHIGEKNIDLMCALHLDKPHHLHIHFVFWEKEAKFKDTNAVMSYRRRGRISEAAIDNMFVRLGMFADEERNQLHMTRDEAIRELKELTAIKSAMTNNKTIKKEIIALAKDLPEDGRLSYGSEDMELFRARVDKIVCLLLDYDAKARKADLKFYSALTERKRIIDHICGQPVVFSHGKNEEDIMLELPKYHHKIDTKNIRMIDDIEADYKRRQGNLVLNLAKLVKPQFYKNKKKYKTNDNFLKRRLSICRRMVDRTMNRFILSFGKESELLERDFTHRLQEIEEEIKQDKLKEKEGEFKD